jgi:endogenous inhibitor of DNA gyrase (YacG/DUF329 family)
MATLVCPICGKQVTVANKDESLYWPFCSLHCKKVDLGRWLTEAYRISETLPGIPPLKSKPDPADTEQESDQQI